MVYGIKFTWIVFGMKSKKIVLAIRYNKIVFARSKIKNFPFEVRLEFELGYLISHSGSLLITLPAHSHLVSEIYRARMKERTERGNPI